MRRLLDLLGATMREIISGMHSGAATRNDIPVDSLTPACRYERRGSGGGPFLHWVQDRNGRPRLAGDYLPEEAELQTPHKGGTAL